MTIKSTNRYTLRELVLIKNGRDHKELGEGNIPVFGSGGLMRYADKAIYNEESILLPRKGTLSNIQYVNKPFWTVDTIYYTIVNKKLANAFFLFNYLKTLDLSWLNSGTGVPSMTFDAYYDLEVFLPEISTQQKIASVLSALDSKIELNNRINAELEAMAKTLYDYWFVQFDFPVVTSSGVERPYKTSGGKMVWNEELKREIPEGWEVKTLISLCDRIGDGIHGTPQYVDESDYFFINGNNLSNGFINSKITSGSLIVKNLTNAVNLPSKSNLDKFMSVSEFIFNNTKELEVIGSASSFYSASFNDQIIQGLKIGKKYL
jgi:type I restriction enzyme S subunit